MHPKIFKIKPFLSKPDPLICFNLTWTSPWLWICLCPNHQVTFGFGLAPTIWHWTLYLTPADTDCFIPNIVTELGPTETLQLFKVLTISYTAQYPSHQKENMALIQSAGDRIIREKVLVIVTVSSQANYFFLSNRLPPVIWPQISTYSSCPAWLR